MALQGVIDEVTGHGRVLGWACRGGRVERLHVGIFQGRRLVAEAIAHHYRADLLAAGMALGHCAFDARLREPLAPGEHRLDLALLGGASPGGASPGGASPGGASPGGPSLGGPSLGGPSLGGATLGGATGLKSCVVKVAEPHAAPPPPLARAQWSDADILANLPRFGLAEQLAALGPERFADYAYQWLHGRWAEPEVQHSVRAAVAAGSFDAEAFLREILLSEERRGKSEAPASPFDGRFPFVYLQDSLAPPLASRLAPAAPVTSPAAPPPRVPRRKPR